MKRRLVLVLCSVVSLCTFLTGCKSMLKKLTDKKEEKAKIEVNEPAPAPQPPAPPPPAPVPAEPVPPPQPVPPTVPATSPVPVPQAAPTAPSDDALISKVNTYVQCINRVGNRTNDSFQRYLSWVAESGPTCQERIIYGLYTLYADGVETCRKAVEIGKASPPAMASLDQSMETVAQTYAELVILTQKADDYYSQQDYKDDNCAKAKEMHPQLMSLFKKFRDAEAQARKELDTIKLDLDSKLLAQIEKEKGRKLEWNVMSFMSSAKRLTLVMPDAPNAAINVPKYLAAFDQLQKDYDSLTAYALANATETQGVPMYSAWESSAKRFFTDAKFVKRDLADGKPVEPSKIRDVLQQYNSMITWANSMRP